MEEKVSSDRYFREAFSSFEQEPPGDAWKRVKDHLENRSGKVRDLHGSGNFRNTVFPLLAAGAVILLGVYLWLGLESSGPVRGMAKMDDEALSGGTVMLFRVDDKAMPFDSVQYKMSVVPDSTGRYVFKDVPYGKYFIRAHTIADSLSGVPAIHRYFGGGLTWDEAEIINWQGEDTSYDIIFSRGKNP